MDSMAYPISPYPEPQGTSAVTWRTRLGAQSYTFVALHLRGFGWFITGQFTYPLSWAALCHHLPPEDGRFLLLGPVSEITAQPVTSSREPTPHP